MGIRNAWGYVPPFRAGERARGAVDLDLAGRTAAGTLLRMHGDFLRDDCAGAEPVLGPGDLRLGAHQPLTRGRGIEAGLGFEAKVPSARDEGELGTDETDVLFGGALGWSDGRWSAGVAAGLAVLGNPLRFANQDDVPMARAGVGWSAGAWSAGALLVADVGTARNPARVSLDAGVEAGRRWTARLGGGVGLTPAAADGYASLALGWRSPLPAPGRGE